MRRMKRDRRGRFARKGYRRSGRRGGRRSGGLGGLFKTLLPVALVGGALWYFFLRKPTVAGLPAPSYPSGDMSAEKMILDAQAKAAEQAAIAEAMKVAAAAAT